MAPVTIYSSSLCGFCFAAKRLLKSKGVAFTELSVDLAPDVRAEMMQRSARTSVPQIWIGETHVGGYDDIAALERDGKLDALLTAA